MYSFDTQDGVSIPARSGGLADVSLLDSLSESCVVSIPARSGGLADQRGNPTRPLYPVSIPARSGGLADCHPLNFLYERCLEWRIFEPRRKQRCWAQKRRGFETRAVSGRSREVGFGGKLVGVVELCKTAPREAESLRMMTWDRSMCKFSWALCSRAVERVPRSTDRMRCQALRLD